MKSIFKIIVVVLLLPAVLFALGANTENGMVITDTRDTIDEILEEVEKVEHHVHNQNKVFGQAASATEIIPKDTIKTPFKINNIFIQDWSAAQIYKLEVLYGYASASISLGIVEVTLGDPATKSRNSAGLNTNIYVPANSVVGG